MVVDHVTAIKIWFGFVLTVGIGALLVIAVDEYKRRQENKRYEQAKKEYLKTLIQLCDTTIKFNKSLANAIDQHEHYASKGDELIEKIAKSASR